MTLEPLLGAQAFRAGASVDCDLTSADQQEETLDPEHSVMLTSQKTEDLSERPSNFGIPGTASNLPQPPPAATAPKASNGVSRRTENVTYQTSRVVRHTKIPQGVIKRMSLAVLVDQSVRWEGDGAAKHRVLAPPAPETLKTIKDLVAGITGFNAERGDQLIVETLPFESSLNAEPPKITKPVSTPAVKNPPWLDFVTKYHDLWAPVSLGLAVLLVLARGLFHRGRWGAVREVEIADELAAPAARAALSPAAAEIAAASIAGAGEDTNELSERVRLLAKREPDLTLNVLRMWLQESKG
jgi:flagellar M-ring protein FliF